MTLLILQSMLAGVLFGVGVTLMTVGIWGV